MSSQSKTTTSKVLTCFKIFENEVKHNTIDELVDYIVTDGHMTDEIQDVIQVFKTKIPVNKESYHIKKKKTKRYSGYHLFMKERRMEMKDKYPDKKPQELIGMVAGTWKDLSTVEKNDFNERAALKKNEAILH